MRVRIADQGEGKRRPGKLSRAVALAWIYDFLTQLNAIARFVRR